MTIIVNKANNMCIRIYSYEEALHSGKRQITLGHWLILLMCYGTYIICMYGCKPEEKYIDISVKLRVLVLATRMPWPVLQLYVTLSVQFHS